MSRIYFLIILFLVIIAGIASWIAFPLFQNVQAQVIAPLPSFLVRSFNSEVTTLDLWAPVNSMLAFAMPQQLSLSAKSALSYDLTTNTPLYESHQDEKLPMASLTKIMTAIIALEHPKSDDAYIVTKDALVGEDSMGVTEGEVLSRKELLYGLILHSGNDAAEVFASNFPGGRESFISAMNDKALALGLSHTHFTNPTGLEGDGDQYTTAYDLLTLTRYALTTFPDFRDVVATVSYTIPQTNTHKEFDLENETNLLTSYPGVKGVKTGYTPEAGLCLVTYLEYGGHNIIGIVLGSDDRRGDMKQLLDYSLKKLHITPPSHS